MRRTTGKMRRRGVRRGVMARAQAGARTLRWRFRYFRVVGLSRFTGLVDMDVSGRPRLEPAQPAVLVDVPAVVPPQVNRRQPVHRCHVQDEQHGRKPTRVGRTPMAGRGLHSKT